MLAAAAAFWQATATFMMSNGAVVPSRLMTLSISFSELESVFAACRPKAACRQCDVRIT
jgi:hypothetical protein